MNVRRSLPWGWILGTVALVLLVGALGYWLGATSAAPERPFMFGGGVGCGVVRLALLALVVAVLVGVIVAAVTQQPTTTETYDEWHRRAHGWPDVTTDAPASTPVEAAADVPPAAAADETVT